MQKLPSKASPHQLKGLWRVLASTTALRRVQESKEEACLEALKDFADTMIGQLHWHANFTDLFGKASDRHS